MESTVAEMLERPRVAALDEILGKKFPVLDDGFVRVVDYMGNDDSIVQAARVSYGKGTKTRLDDEGLVRYLMRHRHTTPFEMAELKLHVRVPMDCWRQWIRHRTANVNEYSTRYSEAIDSAQKTEPDEWRAQSASNKQGSAGNVTEWPEDGKTPQTSNEASFRETGQTPGAWLTHREGQLQQLSREVYEERLDFGVAREQARKDLPLSTYTEAYWKCDLHNLFHFLSLRMDSHAQKEIRDYADVVGREIVAKWCPLAWAAFEDYRLGAVTLSGRDISVIHEIIDQVPAVAKAVAQEYGWLDTKGKPNEKSRERGEFEKKLERLGIEKPW